MNRKQRRQQSITQRPRTLCITEDSLKRELARNQQTTKYESVTSTVRLVLGVMALALNNEFDFGQKRINRLTDRINKELQCIEYGNLSKEDVDVWCKENHIMLT